jgi:hypothetical protein
MKQTFRGSATTAGVSFGGALSADPTTVTTGDLWFRSDAGKLRYFDGTTARYWQLKELLYPDQER